jgi:hypothetical protein
MAARGKALHVPYEGDEGRGREQAYSRNRTQPHHHFAHSRHRLERALDHADARFEFPDLAGGLGQHGAQRVGEAGVSVGDERPDLGHNLSRAYGN